MSRVGGDGVDPAPPVLVIICTVLASAVGTPGSSAVNRLRASGLGALDLLVLEWALLSVQVSLNGNLVGPAALVLVSIGNVVAASVQAPLSNTIDRLSATTLGAVLELVSMWASVTVVGSRLANNVLTAALVLMAMRKVFTGSIL